MKLSTFCRVLGCCMVIVLSGCVRMPHQSGTWIGTAHTITLLEEQTGQHFEALQLTIEEGPLIGDTSFKPAHMRTHDNANALITDRVVLVKRRFFSRKFVLIDAVKYNGQRISVNGMIDLGIHIDAPDGWELTYYPKNDSVGHEMESFPPCLLTSKRKIHARR